MILLSNPQQNLKNYGTFSTSPHNNKRTGMHAFLATTLEQTTVAAMPEIHYYDGLSRHWCCWCCRLLLPCSSMLRLNGVMAA
jgi:hypothetical protein